MADAQPRVTNFYGGEQTTSLEQTAEPTWRQLLNCRVDKGSAVVRPGKVRLHTFGATPTDIMDLDGTNDELPLPLSDSAARSWPLPPTFTVEVMWYADALAADSYVIGGDTGAPTGIKVLHKTDSSVDVVIDTGAGAAVTTNLAGLAVQTTIALQIVRVGTAVTLWANGVSATATLPDAGVLESGNPCIGSDNAASWLNGQVEYFRGFRKAKTTKDDLYCRLLDPYAPSVLFDYVVAVDANGRVLDRSRYQHHAVPNGSPSTARASIARWTQPILAIAQYPLGTGGRQGIVSVDGSVYEWRV